MAASGFNFNVPSSSTPYGVPLPITVLGTTADGQFSLNDRPVMKGLPNFSFMEREWDQEDQFDTNEPVQTKLSVRLSMDTADPGSLICPGQPHFAMRTGIMKDAVFQTSEVISLSRLNGYLRTPNGRHMYDPSSPGAIAKLMKHFRLIGCLHTEHEDWNASSESRTIPLLFYTRGLVEKVSDLWVSCGEALRQGDKLWIIPLVRKVGKETYWSFEPHVTKDMTITSSMHQYGRTRPIYFGEVRTTSMGRSKLARHSGNAASVVASNNTSSTYKSLSRQLPVLSVMLGTK